MFHAAQSQINKMHTLEDVQACFSLFCLARFHLYCSYSYRESLSDSSPFYILLLASMLSDDHMAQGALRCVAERAVLDY